MATLQQQACKPLPLRYIGDLSATDAELLAVYARNASRILEFGSGASTQILAKNGSIEGTLISVETEPKWIERTKQNLARLSIEKEVRFIAYRDWQEAVTAEAPFDLIFDDGADKYRERFALDAWKLLKAGGRLLFHDTRRKKDFGNVLSFLQKHYLEVSSVGLNEAGSNITVLTRKIAEPWVDWNKVEGRAKWEYGHAEPPTPLPWNVPPKG